LLEDLFSFCYRNKQNEIITSKPDFYDVIIKNHWMIFNNKNRSIPDQGWKIHLSSSYDKSLEFLSTVSGILFDLNLSWKIPYDANLLKGILLGYVNIELVGKFITIYNENEKQLNDSLRTLDKVIGTIEGAPPVVTDQKYNNNSCIFFRYGAFKNKFFIDQNGIKQPAIMDNNGQLVVDRRIPNEYKPEWIKDPIEF
jgi:hypothetical protein